MAKPKLALIPASQGDKLYSVLPSSGVGDFSFSRSGGATRINSQGLIETVASGVSRLNYPLIDGVVNGCPSHLLEPQRTNLVTYSEDFSQSVWEFGGIIKTPNNSISPDGTLNAEKIEITTLSTPNLRQTIGVLPSTQYTFSFYAKSNELSNLKLAVYDLSNALFIFENEEKLINSQWSRVSVTFTTPSGCNSLRAFIFRNSDTLGSFYVWGGQFEEGSYGTSYIPNYGNAAGVTRSAETATGAGNSTTFNDSEGVLMAEISTLQSSGEDIYISVNNGVSNRITLRNTSALNNVVGQCVFGGVNQASMDYTLEDRTANNKISIRYKLNDFSLWVNGFKVVTDNIGSVPTSLNDLSYTNGNGVANWYGKTKQLQYFDSALADTQLEQLTSWQSFRDMANGQLYTIE